MAILNSSQRVDLRRIIEANHFSVDQFSRRDVASKGYLESASEELRYNGTDYYFRISFNQSDFQHERFYLQYSPGVQALRSAQFSWSWETVCDDFAEYLARLKDEVMIAEDDPWMQPGLARVVKKQQGQKLIPAGNEFAGQRLARLVFATAKKSLDILDPYIGPTLFDRINDADLNIPLRVLTSTKSRSSASYFEAFKKNYSSAELRVLAEDKLHDRFIIIDGTTAYHVGHSIKDLGKKDTQVSPVQDVEPLKKLFDERWTEAKSICDEITGG